MGRTPKYDPLLRAYHEAFAPELRRLVQELPYVPGAKVLDLCCGDGYYADLLAARLDSGGELTAADISDEYLARARKYLSGKKHGARLKFVKSSAYSLPFPDGHFDLAWCAQSFISLDEPVRALEEMRRVVRPGGFAAILESDEYHHLLLPWPVDLEMALQRAVHASFKEKHGRGSRAAPARTLSGMLRQAGWRPRRKRTYPADRQAPFGAPLRRFLKLHVKFLRQCVEGRLSPDLWKRFLRLTDPTSKESLLRRVDADVTCLSVLYLGQ